MIDLEFYEKLYFHEIEAQKQIESRYQIPLAILVSLISFYGYIVGSLSNYTYFVTSLLGIELLILISAIYFFVRSFYGHNYQLISGSKEISEYEAELYEQYNDESVVREKLDLFLRQAYIDGTTANIEINDKKANNLHHSITMILLNIPVIFMLFVFLINDINSKPKNTNTVMYVMNIDKNMSNKYNQVKQGPKCPIIDEAKKTNLMKESNK